MLISHQYHRGELSDGGSVTEAEGSGIDEDEDGRWLQQCQTPLVVGSKRKRLLDAADSTENTKKP
jgi:hypothetical protein